MSGALIAGVVWALAATVTALLPMRSQMMPGVALLAAAPVLIGWIGWVHGWLWAVGGIAAFLSMFRNPMLCFARRAVGRDAPLPPELRR